MEKVNGDGLVSIATSIQYYVDAEHHNGVVGGDLTDAHREEFREVVAKWRADLAGGLLVASTRDQLQRIKNALEDGKPIPHVRMMTMLQELSGRFLDDVGRCVLLHLEPKEVDLLIDQQPFGPNVYEAFPSAIDDIEEAAKSLSFGRATATVFHLMRVMEAGLKAVAAKMGVPYAPSWESYLSQLKKEIDRPWKDKKRTWRNEETFYTEVYSHLSAVKVAWRNPTMHIIKHYTPDTAEDIYNSVKGFMRHLATKLSEPKPRVRNRYAKLTVVGDE